MNIPMINKKNISHDQYPQVQFLGLTQDVINPVELIKLGIASCNQRESTRRQTCQDSLHAGESKMSAFYSQLNLQLNISSLFYNSLQSFLYF